MIENNEKPVRLGVSTKGEKPFRRAGYYFTRETIEDSFAEDVARRLLDEPMLVVEVLDDGGTGLSELRPKKARGTAVVAGKLTDESGAPIASGLEDGMQPVPSDKTGGRPESVSVAVPSDQERALKDAPTAPETAAAKAKASQAPAPVPDTQKLSTATAPEAVKEVPSTTPAHGGRDASKK